jgi:hypothetical protein
MTNASPPHNRLFLLYCSSALRRPQFWRPNPCSQLRRSISQSHGQDLGHYAGYLYRPSAGPSAGSRRYARRLWSDPRGMPPQYSLNGSGADHRRRRSQRFEKGSIETRILCRSRSFTPVRRNELYSVTIPGRTLYCVMKRNRCAIWELSHAWG